MMDKLDIFESSLRRDDESILHRLCISEGMEILERISIAMGRPIITIALRWFAIGETSGGYVRCIVA
jgi:hypothetical protein